MLRIKPIFTVAFVFLLTCNSFSQENRQGRHAKKNYTYQTEIEETPENDESIAQLGYDIENAIHTGEIDQYMAVYDTQTFKDLMFEGIEDKSETKEFKDAFLKGIDKGLSILPTRLINEVQGDSYYDFVNYGYDYEYNTYYILFRLYSLNSGLNYHEYRVSKINEKFVFNDIYIYLSGEPLSKTFNRLYLYTIPEESLFSIFGTNNAKEFFTMADAVKLYQSKNFNEAYKKFNNIEGDLSHDKFVLVLKTMCAAEIGDAEYKKAMKEIMDEFPDDSSLKLSQVDYHILNKQHDTAIDLLDNIENDTNDDFLNLLKGNVEYDRGNFEKALNHFKYMSNNYPDFFIGHSSYLSCLAAMSNFEACGEFLTFLVDEGYEKKDLVEFVEELDENGENELIPLMQSEPYINWKNQS